MSKKLKQIEEYNNEYHYTDNPNSDVHEDIKWLINRIKELEIVMDWYANESYKTIKIDINNDGHPLTGISFGLDKGKKARNILDSDE